MLKGIIKIVVAMVVTLSIGGCNDASKSYLSIEGVMLGTTYHINAEIHKRDLKTLRGRVQDLDAKMKREMSIFDPNSIISRINRGESDMLTPWLEQNIRLADSISRISGGIYDITVAPLVEAWGFGASKGVDQPKIDSLLEFVGYDGISISEERLVKRDQRMQIDLNSIAKGFAVDRMVDIILDLGSENFIAEIGGELRLGGVNPKGESWRVGVESPIDGNMTNGELLQRRIAIDGSSSLRSLATSGNYRRFHLDASGNKVVHTIDPTTGLASPSSLLSVTVLAKSCAEADALATMLMAAGDSRAEDIVSRLQDCEVYLIYNNTRARDGESEYIEYLSEGMRERLLD